MKITSLGTLPITEVSHNPTIKKQMMIGFDELRPLAQFSRAVFPPGEYAPGHSHSDMAEVFFVESGNGVININGTDHTLGAGDCVTVEIGEKHELRNDSSDENLVVIYFGVFMS